MPGAYLWAWDPDAEKYVKVIVDGAGKLYVGSCALPPDAATQTTLALILAEAEDIIKHANLNIEEGTKELWIREAFGGATYVNSNAAEDDDPRRFETSEKMLRDVIITVGTYAQLFGDSSNQTYRVLVGEAIGFTKVDISTLYFKNYASGLDGTVHILGVEE